MSAILSIDHGTPLGNQQIVISGLSTTTLLTVTAATIESRACTISSQSAGSCTIVTPARLDANGDIIDIVSVVDIVLTLSNATTVTIAGAYTYYVTRWDLALQALRTNIAAISKSTGYNYDITASQIFNYQVDQNNSTGAAYPQVIVYGGPIKYDQYGQDSPYGFYTGIMHAFIQAVIPLSNKPNWDLELRLLQSDLFRAVMLTRQHDNIALNYGVTDCYPGRVTDPSAGALGVATIELDIELKHIITNMNSVTQGE